VLAAVVVVGKRSREAFDARLVALYDEAEKPFSRLAHAVRESIVPFFHRCQLPPTLPRSILHTPVASS
jgi:hypothetical protein